jgi:hypothetical protein
LEKAVKFNLPVFISVAFSRIFFNSVALIVAVSNSLESLVPKPSAYFNVLNLVSSFCKFSNCYFACAVSAVKASFTSYEALLFLLAMSLLLSLFITFI